MSLHPSAPKSRKITAHKFGGSSLADASRIRHVANLLRDRRADGRQVIVVSAMQGVTSDLIALADRLTPRQPADEVESRDEQIGTELERLRRRHREVAQQLLDPNDVEAEGLSLLASIDAQFDALSAVLRAGELIGAIPDDAREWIAGLGEVLSARIVAATLGARFVDARDVLVVERTERGAVPDYARSRARIDALAEGDDPLVVTGYVARTIDGAPTTLGRNGSDYSGAIFAALFDADELHIWTDVDGVLSADPRRVPDVALIPALSYEEACELAYFGAKVVHPQTIEPAISRGIPIRIRNTFNPSHEGSLISQRGAESAAAAAEERGSGREPGTAAESPVTGLTTIDALALLDLVGTGLLGVPGTAERFFGALRAARISVVMISQGSSEHSICCAVRAHDADRALAAVREAFAMEIERGHVEDASLRRRVSLLAAVGDRMAGQPGVAARLFDSLARAGVNVRAIAQGSTERNISVAIDEADATRALRAAHAAFYLSPQTLSIGLVGPGQVGRALLEQIEAARDRLLSEQRIDLRVRALASRKRLSCVERGATLRALDEAPTYDAERDVLDRLEAHVDAQHLPHAVIVDCTASDAVADRYAEWLSRGIHVVTPNKQAGSGSFARYRAIRDAAARSGARFRYEATVGAGLPVIQTLRDLVDTGDDVHSIEGMFSGTLAWLFAGYDGRVPFSARVLEARALGYTEPDPRDDLSGRDVARKLVILAREIGLSIELADVEIESLVPPELERIDRDAFLRNLSALDEPMRERLERARAANAVLRYVARLDADGRARVRLTELPHDHPFAHAQGTDNVVRYVTRRYARQPLVVQGPGAGPDVTAAGIFADILRIAASLGARA